MSTRLTAKLGSREPLKVRNWCGCSLCACQMRCTEPSEMPVALAIARPVQWVADGARRCHHRLESERDRGAKGGERAGRSPPARRLQNPILPNPTLQ